MQIKKKTIPHKYRNKYLRNGLVSGSAYTSSNSSVTSSGSTSLTVRAILEKNDTEALIKLPTWENPDITKQGTLSVDENGFLRFR